MKKRLAKKKQVERYETYRGIGLWQGWAGPYSYAMPKSQKVMIMFPAIEGYASDFTQAKKCVDKWYQSGDAAKHRHKRKHPNPECPF